MQQRGSQHFEAQPQATIPRSTFNLSQGHKTSINAGWLVPFLADEILPGDTFNVRTTIMGRLATPLRPLMDNVYIDIHYFFVPNRLLWSNFQKFMGEQDNPGDSTDFLLPQIVLTPSSVPAPPDPKSTTTLMYNYMGVPLFNMTSGSATVCNLWGRAYNRIWNEFYRDENLQTRAVQDTGDGPDSQTNYYLRPRGKRHDYFTTCLPWPQKAAGVSIPISGIAPVVAAASGAEPGFQSNQDGLQVRLGHAAGATPAAANWTYSGSSRTQNTVLWRNPTGLAVDLSANSGTINSLRQAYQIQKYLERDARGGTRYIEKIRSHFGVTSPDARLQRPEYLGGGSVPLICHPVPQNSGTAPAAGGYSDTPQGNLAAFGVAAGTRAGFTKSFVEHGVLLGLMSIRADLNYQQGLRRMFSRRTVHDVYWPEFAHLGEQAVLNKEIYMQNDATNVTNNAVFGYQERYAEYKYGKNIISGVLQSQYPQSLDIWHLAEEFTSLPTLSGTFIESNPPIGRVIAVPSEPHFIVDVWNQIKAARPMPVFGIPGMSDHL